MNEGRIRQIFELPGIQFHISWALILPLVTLLLATQHLPVQYRNLSPTAYWLLGSAGALLTLASVLFHEAGHLALSAYYGCRPRRITLLPFGGLPQSPAACQGSHAQLLVALAGPLASLALAGSFAVLWQQGMGEICLWLALLNLSLALLNLLPADSFDGSRMLRAAINATALPRLPVGAFAFFTSFLITVVFLGVGVFAVLTGASIEGILLLLTGWLVLAYTSTEKRESQRGALSPGVTIADLVIEEVEPAIFYQRAKGGDEMPPTLSIATMPTLAASSTKIQSGAATTGSSQGQAFLPVVPSDTELQEALRQMEAAGASFALVTQEHRLVGLLSRDQILRFASGRTTVGTWPN